MWKPFLLPCLITVFVVPAQAEQSSHASSLSDSLGWLIGTWEDAASAEDPSHDATKISFHWAAGNQVILMEGSYVAEEATWAFAAVFFYDTVNEQMRVLSFNSNGRRHSGLLTDSELNQLTWRMSGSLPDGRLEHFVMKFVRGDNDTLGFHLKDRRPSDDDSDSGSLLTLRRVKASG